MDRPGLDLDLDLEYLLKIVDNILVQAPSIESFVERVIEVLTRCRKVGIKLSLL